jgi:hypothetical protein
MGAEEKTNPTSKETRASRLTCADCAVDIDKLLAEIEEDEPSGDKSSHLVFDVSRLGIETTNSPLATAENATGGEEQGQD